MPPQSEESRKMELEIRVKELEKKLRDLEYTLSTLVKHNLMNCHSTGHLGA